MPFFGVAAVKRGFRNLINLDLETFCKALQINLWHFDKTIQIEAFLIFN